MAANPKDISWLLFIGININTTKEFLGLNTTPLIVAVSTRNNDLVKVFLNAGADPNKAIGFRGSDRTPLQEATLNANSEEIKIILDHGANPNKVSMRGDTALTYALGSLDHNREAYRATKDVIKLLIDGGARPKKKDRRKMVRSGLTQFL